MQETWFKSLSWEDSPGEGNGYPLQDSGLENAMDCIVHAIAKSQTQLSEFLRHSSEFYYYYFYFVVYCAAFGILLP